jgi:uncharacterized protein (TIGR03067 family)
MIRMAVFLAASLVFLPSAQTADKPKEASVALEWKLLGGWQGGACVGELTLRADGTFERQHYSPGNHELTGTWRVRWNALPPTLVLTCKASDYAGYVGKTEEVHLMQLNEEALAYQYRGEGQPVRYTRVSASNRAKEELAALQGTWVPLHYEEEGKKVQGAFHCKHLIKGDQVTVQVNGETKAEGKVVLDPTQSPKHLDFQFTSGQTDLLIYVRAGDYVIYCGNRGGKRPLEFVSGTARGGAYLLVWKIER